MLTLRSTYVDFKSRCVQLHDCRLKSVLATETAGQSSCTVMKTNPDTTKIYLQYCASIALM
uniref:Uncharacterized protein n=1 Tax=Anguilla anguilla TaxID=7936 RepID=A0A0E9WCQ0_ANGAN